LNELSFIAGATLLAIALLHAAWAAGVSWPADTPAALSRLVYGRPGPAEMPPRAATLAAAAAIAAGAWLLFAAGRHAPWPLPEVLLVSGLALLSAVFAARGLATFVFGSPWRLFGAEPEEPFATKDRRLYAPVCLMFAYASGVLALHVAQDYGALAP